MSNDLALFDLPTPTTSRPFIKWPGGKTQLLDRLLPLVDAHPDGTYYEPFTGGGAVLLAQSHARAVAGDINASLVGMYRTVGNQHRHVADELQHIQAAAPNDEDHSYYYRLRDEYNHLAPGPYGVRHAALFLTMSKWCFNGLYRQNQKGQFNASFCKQYRALPTHEQLEHAASKLATTQWGAGDFATLVEGVQPGDTVFLDPPYVPVPGTIYTRYNKRPWTEADDERVANLAHTLNQQGVHVVATNHNLPRVHELYEGFTITPVTAARRINGGQTNTQCEVIITNIERPHHA